MNYEQVLIFCFWINYLFWSQCFVQKVLYEKVWIHTCTNILFITRSWVCMYMHICVCMNICINWGGIYWPKTKVFTKSKARHVWYVLAKVSNDHRLCFFGRRPEPSVFLPNCWQQRLLYCFHKICTINLFCLSFRQQRAYHFNSKLWNRSQPLNKIAKDD